MTARDVRGLRIRVMAAPTESRVWACLGAEPVPMPFREIHGALAGGAVDAADDTTAVYVSQRHHEVAPYHMLTRHHWSLSLLVINASVLAALPDEIRDDLSPIGRDLTGHVVDFAARSESAYLERLRADPTVDIVPVDAASFRARVEGLADRVAEALSIGAALDRVTRLAH